MRSKCVNLFVLLILLADTSMSDSGMEDEVTALPGLAGSPAGTQFAGYTSVYGAANPLPSGASNNELFYWFVGKTGADCNQEPTILWSNGGPGATSLWGFFLENGPYTVSGTSDTPVLKQRPHAWNNFANYMVFDHPLGVGLSNVSESEKALPHNATAGIQQLYQALLNFFEKHPKIGQNPLILAGESYAGTYLPLLAKAIILGNKRFAQQINLHAMVIGDAWVNPWLQMAQGTTYAFNHGLISEKQKKDLDALPVTQASNAIAQISGVNMANIAKPQDAVDPWSGVMDYLNRADLRKAVHANIGPAIDSWWSPRIANLYDSTVNDNYTGLIQELLDAGLQTIIVSGLDDAKDCNFLATQAWMDLLTGDVARDFRAADTLQWRDHDKRALGYVQESSTTQLSWIKVLHAGHMSFGDQPLLIDLIMEKMHLSNTIGLTSDAAVIV